MLRYLCRFCEFTVLRCVCSVSNRTSHNSDSCLELCSRCNLSRLVRVAAAAASAQLRARARDKPSGNDVPVFFIANAKENVVRDHSWHLINAIIRLLLRFCCRLLSSCSWSSRQTGGRQLCIGAPVVKVITQSTRGLFCAAVCLNLKP